jgi:cytochrome P450
MMLVRGGARKGPGGAELPPGPRLDSAVQAAAWAFRPLTFMERAHERFGEIFTLRVRRGRPWVLMSNPEHVKHAFTAAPELFLTGAGDANPLLVPLLGERSVMLLDGSAHMRDRKLILPSFQGKHMSGYAEMMLDVAHDEVARWRTGEPFPLWPRMQAVSLEVVMRAVFGDVTTARMARLRRQMTQLIDWVNVPRHLALLAVLGPQRLSAGASYRAVMEPVERTVLEEVRERRAAQGEQEDGDILAMLERAHSHSGAAMSEAKLRDELVMLLMDGPTSTSLAWVFEFLLRDPPRLARLREEVRGGEDAYLDAVIKEILRLRPPVPLVVRRLLAPMQFGSFTIPPGAAAAPCIYLMHRRRQTYPDPNSFRPERFLGDSPGPYSWIPFGGGVRRCLAAGFALLEMRQVMKVVLGEVELRPVVRRSERVARSSVAFAPGRGTLVEVARRTGVGRKGERARALSQSSHDV